MTIEHQLEQLKKRNKRLTVGLTMIAVTIAAVVTMAATNVADGDKRMRYEFYFNDAGGDHALLDNATGDLWRINKTTKKLVTLKR